MNASLGSVIASFNVRSNLSVHDPLLLTVKSLTIVLTDKFGFTTGSSASTTLTSSAAFNS